MSSSVLQHVGNKDFTRSTVVIIGAGVSGICMAIDLLRRTPTRNFVILEKGSAVGGTWSDNRYPGSSCDVWGALYSFSFEQRSDWTREYPGQEELLAYLTGIAEQYGLYRYIRFNSTVKEARWDDDELLWKVQVAVAGAKDSQYQYGYELRTDFLVSAVGQLNVPSYPRIPGLDDFTGKMMHSARWDWGYCFEGKRVGVVGNGATAIQIVPELAKTASQVTVYQRTPNWIVPRLDQPISALQRFLLTYVPPLRVLKRVVLMRFKEWTHDATTNPDSRVAQRAKALAVSSMKSQLVDKPELWDTLIPSYPIGCRRIVPTDDYFHALNAKHVDLETCHIQRVTETGIETEDGAQRDFDLIVLATGFRTIEFLHPMRIYGANGCSLEHAWRDGATAYYGVTVEDLPNFGMFYGPNTNLGHNSIILMIEAQSRYLSTLIGAVVEAKQNNQSLALQPRSEVVREYNDRIQEQLQRSSFADPRCNSWYKLDNGRVTNNWPGTVVQYQTAMSQVRWTDYFAHGSGQATVEKKKPTYIGRVKEEMFVSNTTLTLGVVLAAGGFYFGSSRGWKW
ncbi:flavin-binding monooxygenase [Aspergillus ellipticus CBS 707.79]|uniref:Flavin-binding monooxygenase n=1 Tax=Aspergillus ellipticus CBS 707.79 TaxID=1448320 RepID=A0A319DHG3_9EURO|nr:flavin-binding monooxygenase [Aspergillus ellipticus CBS 707.79]